MSRQSNTNDGDFILLNRAKDLYIYTSELVGNEKLIPKRRRYPTGQRLEGITLDILSKATLANEKDLRTEFAERQQLQGEVVALCRVLETLINALKASKAYPGILPHKAEVWTEKVLDVRYLCAAWKERELERHNQT